MVTMGRLDVHTWSWVVDLLRGRVVGPAPSFHSVEGKGTQPDRLGYSLSGVASLTLDMRPE